MDAFISYSHRDANILDRLHVHLAVLRRDGIINAWYDRDILAGGPLDPQIAERLESSSLFLLLITPDFLNSSYCVEREMARAMERQAAGEARVIAIIAEPCDWQSTILRELKVLPHDGRPISEWTNKNSAYLNVVQEIRRAIDADRVETQRMASSHADAFTSAPAQETQRRYRAKRDFDDIDRSEFRESSFDEMREYFNQAAKELNSLEDFRAKFSDISPTSFGCTIVNRARDRGTAHLTVHRQRGRSSGLGDIYWSFEENAPENSANDMLTISNDEFQLYFSGGYYGSRGRSDRSRLTAAEAAKVLWDDMLQRAGIDYE